MGELTDGEGKILKNHEIIQKDRYGVSGGPLMAQCPKCFYEAKVDPNCEICDGKYEMPWEDRYKYKKK